MKIVEISKSLLFVCCILLSVPPVAWPAPVQNWASLLDSANENPDREESVALLVEEARQEVEKPLVRRVHRLEDIGKHRTWLDGRSKYLEDEIQETFALAMSDFGTCNGLARELPLVAAAYRLTKDPAFLERALEQLEEMAGWSPLQRPGWTLYAPGNRLPEDGQDGNWLATGTGVRAISDTLEILPDNAVPVGLTSRLRSLLEKEISSVVEDWETERSWFIRTDNPITNQWVLPTEGLVRACLVVGKEDHPEAYALGVKNLMRALDAHGDRGEFEEGFGYASFTVSSLLHTAHAMAVAGDSRAIDHPFLKNFSTWLVHHFQPGGFVINCFDAGGAFGAAESTRPLLSLLAVCTGSPVARWALEYQLSGPSEDLAGLAAAGLSSVGSDASPPLYASYERATRLNWRSGWEEEASGVWIRGGHATDQHDHQDRGHVNFIHRGRPILIEAGTPSYDHPRMMTHYSSGVGHNILQLGTYFPEDVVKAGANAVFPGWQKVGCVAPLTVQELDQRGGKASVNCSDCYEGLETWNREVEWRADALQVVDEVRLAAETQPDYLMFRWHLGTEDAVEILSKEGINQVRWNDAVMTFEASCSLLVSQVRLPDHTLPGHDGSDAPKNSHTCVVVQSASPESTFRLTTKIIPVD